MLDLSSITDDDLRHGVGEVTSGGKAHVALDDGRLAAPAGYDERPGVGDGGLGVVRRNEDQVQRRLERFALRDMDKGPVLKEGGVQSGKPVVFEGGLPAQVLLHHIPIGGDRLGQAGNPDAVQRRRAGRERLGVTAVDKDQVKPAVVPGNAVW